MAKGKNATALFEVMSKHKLAGGKTGSTPDGTIPTPKWWFTSKNRAEVRTIAPGETLEAAPPQDEQAHQVHEEEAEQSRHAPAMPSLMTSSIDVPEMHPSSPAPRVQPVSVSVDPDRQQINLRLSYTSALIGGFGLFIVLGLVFLIGKSLTRGPSTAIANNTSTALKSGPVTPNVLNVPRGGSTASPINDAGEATPRPAPGNTTRNPVNEVRPPTTFFTDDPHRQNGLNYAIIQSYPDKESADKAAEFLTRNGIPCTVEKNLPNWKLPWNDGCVVVGIRGFAKVTNNPSLESYKKSIMDVSGKFTNGKSRFAAFAPTMYSWKRSN